MAKLVAFGVLALAATVRARERLGGVVGAALGQPQKCGRGA
jgi:hypothetical protein